MSYEFYFPYPHSKDLKFQNPISLLNLPEPDCALHYLNLIIPEVIYFPTKFIVLVLVPLKKALSVPLLAALLNCLLEEHQDPRNYT
jgi:hypothetical protein